MVIVPSARAVSNETVVLKNKRSKLIYYQMT